ncbi:MAG: hypothetical protein LBU60_05550, partial [Clostridiales bacterium]|nr:hypothetical protein [Clostridiales bacterium]
YVIGGYDFQDNNLMIEINRQNPHEVVLQAFQSSILLLDISKDLTNGHDFIVDVKIENNNI